MNEAVEIEEKQHGNFILAAAAWQDTLLQAYRGYLLFTQAIFLAVSVGLLTAQVSSQNYIGKLVFFVPNFSVAVLAVVTLTILHKAIIDRSKSVDWWQRSLLRWEKGSDDSRYFTTFRIRKEHSFLGPEIVANQLSNDQIESLLRPEKPKARQVFGIFMPGFLILWIIVGGCAGFDLLFELLTS